LERWLPKAGFAGKRFDLRVVVVAGRARHVILRLGDHAMTNLHLGARRGDTEALRAQMGNSAWNSALGLAEKAIQAFPGSLYGGIDLLISPGWKKAYVLEVNAFGDFLPQATWNGMDTFTCEFKSWKEHLNNQVSTIGW
jgi:glutathione synthase/RimK-type ligase-like ATP-grasp enzyme